jgi:hypothetical protein
MEKKIGIALLCIVGIVVLGLISRWSKDVWIVVDLAIIITCAISGVYLIKSDKKTGLSLKTKNIIKRIFIGLLVVVVLFILFAIYLYIDYSKQEQIRIAERRRRYAEQMKIEEKQRKQDEERKRQETETFLKYWNEPYPFDHKDWTTADFDLKWKFGEQYEKYGEIYVTCEWVIATKSKEKGLAALFSQRPIIELFDKDGFVIATDVDGYTSLAPNQRYFGKFELNKRDALRVRKTGIKWRNY